MNTKLFFTLLLTATLCFYGCTKTEIVEIVAPINPTEDLGADELEDDEFYSVSGEGTKEKPYTVSQALEMLDSGTYDPNKGYYVKGIVSCVAVIITWFEGLYTIGYYMSEDGHYSGESDFFVDNGFALGGEYFTSQDALSAGDKVIVYGRFAIDELNNDRREMVYGKLCYWNGETAEVEEDEDEAFGDGEAVEDDYFKEPGDGTAESPYTISQVVELIDSKSLDSDKEYYVKGIINSANGGGMQDDGRTYWLTEDGAFKSADQPRLYVSNAYDAHGASYPGTRSPLYVGDKVIVYGKLDKYLTSAYRMTEGVLYSWNGRMFVGSADDPLTVTQALHLERNNLYDPDKIYYIEGVVYGNFGLQDNGCMLYEIYNGADALGRYEIRIEAGYSFGGTRFNSSEELSYKDEVIVYGRLSETDEGKIGVLEIGDLYYLNGEVASVVIEEDNEDEDISQYLGDDFREFSLYYFDLTHNGKISVTEAELVTEINSSTVEDFAGIEYFPNLQSFTSSSAKYLYLRYNTELSYINMKGAPFEDHLDLSYNTKLTAIGEETFKNCYLKSISFPEGLTSIGKDAFNKCYSLETVTFSGSALTAIENGTFSQCQSLKSIAIPEGVKSIGEKAFYYCWKLTTVTFSGNSLETIGAQAFEDAGINSIEFPESLTSIGNYAFYGGLSGSVTFKGNNLKTIGNYAFYSCGIKSIAFPESLTSIGKRAFGGGISGTVTFSENNSASVGEYAFYGCSKLTAVENLATIGAYAFSGCTNLTTVSFSKNGLASIGQYAFTDCTNLTSVSFPENSVSEIKYHAFYKCTNLTTIPSFPESLMSIAEEAFYKTGLTSVSFSSNSLCELGEYAFGECTDLTTITFLENSVTTIGNNAFRECTNLTTISAFPVSLMSIGNYAFYKTNLTSISFSGNSLSEIGDYAFYRAPLESAVLPEGLTTIGTSAFCYTSIKTASIPSSVTILGDYTFGSCTGLESVNLSEGLTSIGEWTFGNCSSLKSVTLPESITTIGYRAFLDCASLKSVTSKPTTPPVVGSYAFSNISTSTLYVPSGSIDAYKNSDWAQWFSNISKL